MKRFCEQTQTILNDTEFDAIMKEFKGINSERHIKQFYNVYVFIMRHAQPVSSVMMTEDGNR